MFNRTFKSNYFVIEVNDNSNNDIEDTLLILLVHQKEVFEVREGKPIKSSIAFEDINIGGKYELNNSQVSCIAHAFEGSLHYSSSDWKENIASISSVEVGNGDINIANPKLRGNHIATYFFDRIIKWLKTQASDTVFEMTPLKLTSSDYAMQNKENGKRRNQLYLNFGYKLDLNEDGSGTSLPTKLSDLNNRKTWKSNIIEIQVDEYVKNGSV